MGRSQGFRTGDNSDGYLLSSISVRIKINNMTAAQLAAYRIKIYDSESDGTPGSEVYELTTPDSLNVDETVHFFAPAGATLDANTNYHVVFAAPSGVVPSAIVLWATTADAETGSAGWSIENSLRQAEVLAQDLPADEQPRQDSFQIGVHGGPLFNVTPEFVSNADPIAAIYSVDTDNNVPSAELCRFGALADYQTGLALTYGDWVDTMPAGTCAGITLAANTSYALVFKSLRLFPDGSYRIGVSHTTGNDADNATGWTMTQTLYARTYVHDAENQAWVSVTSPGRPLLVALYGTPK